ncbi:MAG: TetR/AcrR family transcriptional regulator [Acidobacteria bacterium]|nr:TetR/AcrR family transcriptional regulator [Acidobacteriota bacterium]
MRYSSDYKKQTREKILQSAGRLFREKGYNGVGIDAIMAEVGLTAGGFYAHFDSKEALFSEVIKDILTGKSSALSASLAGKDGEVWLTTLIKSYLSRSHRDNANQGCPLPILTPDITRSSDKTRDTYEKCLDMFFLEISQRMPEAFLPSKDRAIALTAQLIGGLMLARAINNEEFSDYVLRVCQKAALQICEISSKGK